VSVRISIDGVDVEGRAGQTIAGVLIGSGRRSWRTAGSEPRGVFCGIGICHDCVVTVNGLAGVRACLRTAVDGDVVERETR
jgi:hypothetical protein